jgi:RHS repeat-associated protein
VVTTFVNSAFGVPEAVGGPYPSSPPPFRWLGRIGYWWEPDTSQYDVRRRRYDPQRGRWTSRDVLLSHASRFLYAWNSPLLLTDPAGLAATATGEGALVSEFLEYVDSLPSMAGRGAGWLGKGLLGVLGAVVLLLTDQGNIMSEEEEAALATLSRLSPELNWRPPQEDRCRGKCREETGWVTCRHTTDPGRAAMGPIHDRKRIRAMGWTYMYRDLVHRGHWKPVGPGTVDWTSKQPYDFCENRFNVFIGRHEKAYRVIADVQFTEIGAYKRKSGVKDRRSFTVTCCPCCTANNNESTQCLNWHDSGRDPVTLQGQAPLD